MLSPRNPPRKVYKLYIVYIKTRTIYPQPSSVGVRFGSPHRFLSFSSVSTSYIALRRPLVSLPTFPHSPHRSRTDRIPRTNRHTPDITGHRTHIQEIAGHSDSVKDLSSEPLRT